MSFNQLKFFFFFALKSFTISKTFLSRFGKRNDDDENKKKTAENHSPINYFHWFFSVFFAFFFSGSRWRESEKNRCGGGRVFWYWIFGSFGRQFMNFKVALKWFLIWKNEESHPLDCYHRKRQTWGVQDTPI